MLRVAVRVHVTIVGVCDVFVCVLRRGGDVICGKAEKNKSGASARSTVAATA